jgi:hypothetical protein
LITEAISNYSLIQFRYRQVPVYRRRPICWCAQYRCVINQQTQSAGYTCMYRQCIRQVCR